MQDAKVLNNIKSEIEQAEIDILYYKDKIQRLRPQFEICKNPELKEQLGNAIILAARQIQRVRLAQALALKMDLTKLN